MTFYTDIATLLHESDGWANLSFLSTFTFFLLPLLEVEAMSYWEARG